MTRLIDALFTQVQNYERESNDSLAAIEMSPLFHLRLAAEIANAQDERVEEFGLSFAGVPIIFTHEKDDYCVFLNIQQYKLRQRFNEILRIYNHRYIVFRTIISNPYKINSSDNSQFSHINDIENLSKRLRKIDQQISDLKPVKLIL